MRSVLAVAILVTVAAPASAQQPADFAAPVHAFKLPRQLPECGLEALLLRVASDTRVSIGFERTTLCSGHQAQGFPEAHKPLDIGGAEVVDGAPVKDVLGRIAAMVPDYDWAIMDGVAVFRPSKAWKDASDPLGSRVPALRFSEVPAGRVLSAILRIPDPRIPKHATSVDFAGGTVLEALNSLVRSLPGMWYASSNEEKLFVAVEFVKDRSGLSVAAPIDGLSSR